MIHPSDIGARRFAHQAMNTEFEIFCVHEDGDYARQAAWAAFDLLDRLENDLSRFIPNSDISRINAAELGESVRVSRWTVECLDLARQAYDETLGAFDISLGTGLENVEWSACVVMKSAAVQLDLGGIGKGYALDRMAEVLAEWEIQQALLHGGHSSVLALDAPSGFDGWPLAMGDRQATARRRAISASGIRQQGEHIYPAVARAAAWVSLEATGRSPSAVAEAYSTAFVILPLTEVEAIRARHPEMEVSLLEEPSGRADPLVRGRPPGRHATPDEAGPGGPTRTRGSALPRSIL
jgi:thiamine biosynthesis lipoprotein